jgi:transposase
MDASLILVPTKPLWHIRCRQVGASTASVQFSKKVGPWIGLTPSQNQSGERDVSGGITKAGDVNLRRALCQAATVMMHRGRSTWLRT